MGWVKEAIKALKENGICKIRPHGGSMRGKIESGQLVTIQTANVDHIQLEDVVFVRWKGNYLLHLVKDIDKDNVLIGNSLGKTNGWISRYDILGVVTNIED